MPNLMEVEHTDLNHLREDAIIKEFIPLKDIVCDIKTISEEFIRDENDYYAGRYKTKIICVNPYTKKYYLKHDSFSSPAVINYGAHVYSNSLIVHEIEESELTDDILESASKITAKLPEYTKEFPSHSKVDVNNNKFLIDKNLVFKYSLPEKLYCAVMPSRYGEYCYLRKVNDTYRLFYLKYFDESVILKRKECSELFIDSVFKRIDELNSDPVLYDWKGPFGNKMPIVACDRKLTENECHVILTALLNSKTDVSDHDIGGFYVLLDDDNFKIVGLIPYAYTTQNLYKTLVNIAKYGLKK